MGPCVCALLTYVCQIIKQMEGGGGRKMERYERGREEKMTNGKAESREEGKGKHGLV